jgi:Rieske Fe-S protein
MGNESDLNRRKFMEIGIYGISGTIAAVSGVALTRFAIGPSFEKKKSKWIEFELENNPDDREGFERIILGYETKHGWLTRYERVLAFARKTKDDEVVVINATCTHLGCIVTWKEDQKIFQCPCHDGRYDAEGLVISGPPPKPLERHKTKVVDGRIFVATETMPFGGDKSERV